ncbi:hypothetical protein GTQ43_18880 [Nostoc sp. KVJ3]|uniref:hypothetical protein n=1 Tax=Nostoc sp. KVJ3 TaxID=457945 RepID=UPI0022377BC2|nr:hypothetical protein [Nostoc sp. KVJ3]MCW5315802.1 hypothetical protein [Nostoc sp. KVJ3]
MTQDNEERYQKLEEILTRLEKLELHSQQKKSKLSEMLEVLEKLLLPLTLGILAFVTNKASVDISKDQFRLADKQSREQLERQKEENRTNVQQKYIELFYEDIKSDNPKTQIKALSLLTLMDLEVGKKIADWVNTLKSTTPEVRKEAAIVSTDINKFGRLNTYKINIYPENNKQNLLEAANQIKTKLIEYGFRTEQIDVKQETESFFERLGKPKGYEIRYDLGNEEEEAKKLESILKEVYPSQNFIKLPIGSNSRNSMSIFIG